MQERGANPRGRMPETILTGRRKGVYKSRQSGAGTRERMLETIQKKRMEQRVAK